MSRSATSWDGVSADPDPEADLGYELADWGVIRTRKAGIDHLMFLPEEEESLKDEAFIVADSASVCDIERWE